MEFTQALLLSGGVIFTYMILIFIVAQAIKDNSIVDIGWGFGFAISACVLLVADGSFLPRQLVATVMISLWGIRLALHIGRRNIGKGEDPRYVKWRQDWGKWVVPRAFLQVFMLQGLIMWVVMLPITMINSPGFSPQEASLNWLDFLGIGIWAIGFFFEAVGDWQLEKFKANPSNRGKLLSTGLWKYTRHPNYFGDAFLWWGFAFMALNSGPFYIVFIGPAVMNFFLRMVSGVPMLEEYLSEKPGWEEYKRKTNAFVPWFPKK